MQNQFPKVSIITINFNQADVTRECLNSLRKVTYPNLEIFLVDNASAPENRLLQSEYPEVIFIQSDKNLGFTGGNNLAMKVATGDFILLLNNDTEVPADFLEPLLKTFVDHPDAGIVSPKIIFFNSENLIQYAGTTAINPYTCCGHTIGYKETDNGQYNEVRKTDLAHGACMLIKREVMNKIGMLHDRFFIYYEEYDYCEMTKRAGFSIYYNGLTYILHKESVSVGKFSPFKAHYMAKNRVLFARRNFTGWKKPFRSRIILCWLCRKHHHRSLCRSF
ncbi:MAG: glycosyltransferase family 2 protein [Bacteroidetes bacterium]|nr:glycosyltransferase family 2 protein [Bacteroidota bacterium]